MLEQGQHSDPDVRTEYVVNSLKQMQQMQQMVQTRLMGKGRSTSIGNKMPELPNLVGHDQHFSMNGLISYVSLGRRGDWVDRGPPHTFYSSQIPHTCHHDLVMYCVLYYFLQTVPRILNLYCTIHTYTYEDITSHPKQRTRRQVQIGDLKL